MMWIVSCISRLLLLSYRLCHVSKLSVFFLIDSMYGIHFVASKRNNIYSIVIFSIRLAGIKLNLVKLLVIQKFC